MKKISIKQLLDGVRDDLDIKVAYGNSYISSTFVSSIKVQRPGLALAGSFEHIRPSRVELFGRTEIDFYNSIPKDLRFNLLDKIAEINKTVFVVSKGQSLGDEFGKVSLKHSIPIIQSSNSTLEVYTHLTNFLSNALAPSTALHGVCIDVYGMGVVIMGRSGIGKSECALELVKKGHRLVADDIVQITRVKNHIIAKCDDLLRNHIELRGVGILNLSHMFGATSVRIKKKVDIIIEFIDYDSWNEIAGDDRMGLSRNTKDILGVAVPHMMCPVSPGRNMADVVELASRNHLLRLMGYDSAQLFNETVNKRIIEKSI